MKLEVGMYVRTDMGIGKIIVGEQIDFGSKGKSLIRYRTPIEKSSFNLIDLIEVGDYVNGHLVTATYNPNGDEMYHISLQNGKDYILIHNDDEIKSILTHEQYEANCYKWWNKC